MSIAVQVVQSLDNTITEGKHEMKVREADIDFCNFFWDVKIESGDIFLFTTTKTTIWRIRLHAKTSCSQVNGVNTLEIMYLRS